MLYEKEQTGLGQANTLQSVGDLLRTEQAHVEAVEHYEKALALYDKARDLTGTAYTFAELARCRHALGRETERDSALEQALGAAERSGYEHVRQYVFAALVELTGGPEQAESWYTRRLGAS